MKTVNCWECNGSGKQLGFYPCKVCNGTGELIEDDETDKMNSAHDYEEPVKTGVETSESQEYDPDEIGEQPPYPDELQRSQPSRQDNSYWTIRDARPFMQYKP